MSLCFIWALRGAGLITSGGVSVRVTPQVLLRLPWGHDVSYAAEAHHPFQLGTMHVVPWHVRTAPVIARVPHRMDDPRLEDPLRDGRFPDSPDAAETVPASGAGRQLILLGTYAAERFQTRPFDEEVCRRLGELIMLENVWTRQPPAEAGLPVPLELMMDFGSSHLDERLTLQAMAAAGDCSPTTAERLFARYLGTSVQAWLRQLRMREAARLLRTTGLRAGEVARQVGFTDPLYFSRVFRATFGVPPSRYARSQFRP